jgi:hypothetical protein
VDKKGEILTAKDAEEEVERKKQVTDQPFFPFERRMRWTSMP